MKNFKYHLIAAICGLIVGYPIAVFCQDTLHLTLPTKFDFSSPMMALDSANMIVSTIIALIVGYLSPYIPLINKIDKTMWRVAAIIIPSLIMVGIFGFKGDAFTIFITTIWGLFSANSTHQYAVKPIGQALNLPYFMQSDSVSDEEAEVSEAIHKREIKRKKKDS